MDADETFSGVRALHVSSGASDVRAEVGNTATARLEPRGSHVRIK